MIEPARTAANGKLKANVKMVKNLVHAANEEQRLGLTELREMASAATWHLGNCLVAVCKLETNVTDLSLLVAHHQADYRWTLEL